MYRQVFTPNDQSYLVPIPRQWYGKEVEILAFPVEKPLGDTAKTHFASQRILAKDWLSPQEDEAWKTL